jgi:elongation factor Ts
LITAILVKTLRDRTGAGMMDCKAALEECGGDIERAILILRQRGAVAAQRKATREAREGLVEAYVHLGGRIGVLVEVMCETDFVARNDRFKAFAHDVALQVAASRPRWVSREDVPEETLATEGEVYRQQAINQGKTGRVVDAIVSGRIEKFFAETCLLEQPFIKDPDRKVKDCLTDLIATVGENVRVGRFVRLEVGEA